MFDRDPGSPDPTSGRVPGHRISAARFVMVALAILASGGCDAELRPAPGPPVAPPPVESLPAPWSTVELREVVDLQVNRDGEALRLRLGSEDPRVRARASLALASVQYREALDDLVGLLEDSDPAVRREAAFALGQMDLDGNEARLAQALQTEGEAAVRVRLVEALGKRGGIVGVEALLEHAAADPAEEAALALALARAGLRGVGAPGIVEALVRRLTHEDPQVRLLAGYYFGRIGDGEPWREEAAQVRAALDAYGFDDPAAQHLVLALGALLDREDRGRLTHWLIGSEDWRVRTNAARALGATVFLEGDGVRDALWTRVESDPSMHVAMAAAASLTMGLRVPIDVRLRMRDWLSEGPRERWRTQLPFLGELLRDRDPEATLDWIRRMEDVHPVAVLYGLEVLEEWGGMGAWTLLEQLSEHPDPRVRARALTGLGTWAIPPADGEAYPSGLMARFDRALRDGTVPEVAAVLQAMSFHVNEATELLVAHFTALDGDTPLPVLIAYLDAVGQFGPEELLPLVEEYLDHPQPRVRATAGEAYRLYTGQTVAGTELPDPERTVDWVALEELGTAPRLHLETERGEIIVRLAPTLAPLTVQSMAELVRDGLFDGTHFHRVIANFVVQGGDVSLGDGTGFPGYRIRSEFTPVSFRRGIVGMASSGKDTEGSQFFVTHSMQVHLDGAHTAFGWVESGESALDALLQGDRVLRARVEPSPPEP